MSNIFATTSQVKCCLNSSLCKTALGAEIMCELKNLVMNKGMMDKWESIMSQEQILFSALKECGEN